jgi:hypothetical protein
MKKVIGQQGECLIIQIDALPNGVEMKPHSKSEKGFIISHSESGHHHILTGGDVMERTSNVPAGMQIFYAILDAPERFEQDAANPHGSYDLAPGTYEFRISREFNPFTEMARRVAD